MSEQKKCFKCGKTKDLSDFVTIGDGNTSSYCRACIKLLLKDDFAVERYDKMLRQRPRAWK